MRIILTAPAIATDTKTDKPITAAKTLATLDGVVYDEDSCVEYFDGKLEQLNMVGGKIGLKYDKDAKQLRVVTEYISGRLLKPGEVKLLIAATEGQWSDGIGESYFWSEVKPSIAVNLYPMDRGKDATKVEQIDDGSKPPARPKISPLFKAVEDKDLAKVEKLLAKGEDVNAFDFRKGRSILHLAVSRLPAAAKMLIERGADIHSRTKKVGPQDTFGQTPFLLGGFDTPEKREVAQLLLERGADVNAVDSRGWTRLHYASLRYPELVRFLLDNGADPNIRSTQDCNVGQTALLQASDPVIIDLLLERGANPNIREENSTNTAYGHMVWQAGDEKDRIERNDHDRYLRWKAAADHLLRRIREAAEKGDAASQYTLAEVYLNGKGVEKSWPEALVWCRKAAEAGYRMAEYKLAQCYFDGIGVPADPVKGREWCQRAADHGVPFAMLHLGEGFCERGSPEGMAWLVKGSDLKNIETARPDEIEVFRRGVGANLAQIGDYHENGVGVPVDLPKALEYYERSRAMGFWQVREALERIQAALGKKASG